VLVTITAYIANIYLRAALLVAKDVRTLLINFLTLAGLVC